MAKINGTGSAIDGYTGFCSYRTLPSRGWHRLARAPDQEGFALAAASRIL